MRLRVHRRGHLSAAHDATWLPAALAVGGVVVGGRLLVGTYALFAHAYTGSYWAIPGGQVNSVYWASVRFAFGTTVLVAIGIGLLGALTCIEIGRAVRR